MTVLIPGPAAVTMSNVVPRAVTSVALTALANPYTATIVGVTLAGFAIAKTSQLVAPDVAMAGYGLRSMGRGLRRKLHRWTADVAPAPRPAPAQRPAQPMAAE